MSWFIYNGFKFIINCIIVYNNLYNNDWNDFEYILILFVNIFYNIVIFNIVIDYINVLLYILILFISNNYYICNWIYYDYIFVFIYIFWFYLLVIIIIFVFVYILIFLFVFRDYCIVVLEYLFVGWVFSEILFVVFRRFVVRF